MQEYLWWAGRYGGRSNATRLIIPASVANDASGPALPDSMWEQQFGLQRPDLYQTYKSFRTACNWSRPVSAKNFTWHTIAKQKRWLVFSRNVQFRSALQKAVDVPLQWCYNSSFEPSQGTILRYITRIGPFDLSPGQLLYFLLLIAGPQQDHEPGSPPPYLVETVDIITNQRGESVRYPPIHPHHSATRIVTPNPQPIWANWIGFPQVTNWNEIWQRSGFSANVPGFVPDLRCEGVDDPAACYYIKMPDGTGMVLPLHNPISPLWFSDAMVDNIMQSGSSKEESLYIEFGRKWIQPSSPHGLRDVSMLDFSVNKDSNIYGLPVSAGPSIAWTTYVMPASGCFLRSYLHTHAQVRSEMWIFDTHYRALLPPALVALGSTAPGGCKNPASVTGCHARATALWPFGLDEESAKRHLMTANASALRCRFRSERAAERMSAGGFVGRAPRRLRSSANSCDSWKFGRADTVTIIAFNEAVDRPFNQHSRWWVLADLG